MDIKRRTDEGLFAFYRRTGILLPLTGGQDPPENDHPGADASPKDLRDYASRQAQAAKDAAERETAATTEAAAAKAELRRRDVAATLKKIGAPDGLAKIIPADADVSEEALTKYVREELGIEAQPLTQGWEDVDALRGAGGVVTPKPDELQKLAAEAVAETKAGWDRMTVPTPEEIEKYESLEAKANDLNRHFSTLVERGEIEPINDISRGFGGPHDVPPWANKVAV